MPRRPAPDPLSRRIGERVRELRLEAGLTLEKLAYESDLGSKGHLSDLERGLVRPTVSTLESLARHLGVLPLDLLVFREDGKRAELVDASRTSSETAIALAIRALRGARANDEAPFRVLARRPKSATAAVPLLDLAVAAGGFGAGRAVEIKSWVVPRGATRLREGMFVALVKGDSMTPRIPNGAYCLFAAPVRGIPSDRIVLVEHHGVEDPETGGSYSVKKLVLEERKARKKPSLRLVSENPAFAPLEIEDRSAVRIVAELVSVLGKKTK